MEHPDSGDPDSADIAEIRASVRRLCADFPGRYWQELDRQVRIRGGVEKLPAADDDAYFSSRSRDARIGAWASPQSQPIADRGTLDARVMEAGERFAGDDIPRPEFWGGFLVRPERIEFWQGQAARLHDRFVYTRAGDGWEIQRLAP